MYGNIRSWMKVREMTMEYVFLVVVFLAIAISRLRRPGLVAVQHVSTTFSEEDGADTAEGADKVLRQQTRHQPGRPY